MDTPDGQKYGVDLLKVNPFGQSVNDQYQGITFQLVA